MGCARGRPARARRPPRRRGHARAGAHRLLKRTAQPGPERARLRDADFVRLWAGQAVSELGSQVSLVAVPLAAVVALGADAFQAGLLGTFEFLPFLVVGLPAGAVVDRLPRRAVLIAADAGRAAALASVPVAAAAGHLTLAQLYAVAFVAGVLTVFFDVAYQSYLPELVGAARLVDANGRLELSRSGAALTGPGLGGALTSILGAPRAVAVDAASYVCSVASLLLIRGPGRSHPAPPPPLAVARGLRAEILEGVRLVLGHRLLRPIAGCTATWNLFAHMGVAIYVLFAVRELGMSPVTIGVVLSVSAVGGLAGAAVVGRVIRRLGLGASIVTGILLSPSAFLIPVATPASAVPLLVVAGAIGSFSGVLYNVAQVSLRQSITPARLLGRLNATMRFIVWGTIPVGSLLGGVLGGAVGLRPTLVVAAAGQTLAGAWVLASPVPGIGAVEDVVD